MIFSIDVIDGEVGGDHLLDKPFRRVELFQILFLTVTFLIATLIDSYILFLFPFVESIAAIGAIIFGVLTILFMVFLQGKRITTYLTF